MKQKNYVAFKIGMVLASIGASVVIAQLLFTAWQSNASSNTTESFKCRELNPILGGGFKPNCQTRWKRSRGGRVIYDVAFSTDQFGRRNTPGATSQGKKDMALFFGCSFTLGAGVNDNETTPYYFSAKASNFNVYNYAGSGFGPQQMLAALSELNLTQQLPHVIGRKIAFYQFLDFHVQRAVGKPTITNSYGRYFPYYALDEKGDLVRKGNFLTGRPFQSRFYKLVNKVPLLEYLLESYTYPLTENDIQLTVRIIAESSRRFQKIFGSNEFFVVIFPQSESQSLSRFIDHLKKAGVQYIDLQRYVDMSVPDATLPDGHPSKRTHKQVGEKLADLISQQASEKDRVR